MKDFANKIIICIFCVCSFSCKFRLAHEPTALTYMSISEAKSNDAFVKVLKSKEQYFVFDHNKYHIDEAWIEHPYIQKNFYDEIEKDIFCFVVTCHSEKAKPLNFQLEDYIKGIGTGDMRIWFYLEELQDTVTVHFKESKELLKKEKTMQFY